MHKSIVNYKLYAYYNNYNTNKPKYNKYMQESIVSYKLYAYYNTNKPK